MEPTDLNILAEVPYGSKLYGTNTATSDTDNKAIYLPAFQDVILGKKQTIFKSRFDAEGNVVGINATMPDNGVETEFIPFQRFVYDFVAGQTYALEVAYAINSGRFFHSKITELVAEMVSLFANKDVYSMTSFAQKQTLDYVYRGERLNALLDVMSVLDDVLRDQEPNVRLDAPFMNYKVLDFVSEKTGLGIGQIENRGKFFRTLEINGRSHMDTTEVRYLKSLMKTAIDGYGQRSQQAAATGTELKSFMHAIRVYQQAIELLDTGKITFPRANAADLLAVKQGKVDGDVIKEMLKTLDAEVLARVTASTMPDRAEQDVVDTWLLSVLMKLYAV